MRPLLAGSARAPERAGLALAARVVEEGTIAASGVDRDSRIAGQLLARRECVSQRSRYGRGPHRLWRSALRPGVSHAAVRSVLTERRRCAVWSDRPALWHKRRTRSADYRARPERRGPARPGAAHRR